MGCQNSKNDNHFVDPVTSSSNSTDDRAETSPVGRLSKRSSARREVSRRALSKRGSQARLSPRKSKSRSILDLQSDNHVSARRPLSSRSRKSSGRQLSNRAATPSPPSSRIGHFYGPLPGTGPIPGNDSSNNQTYSSLPKELTAAAANPKPYSTNEVERFYDELPRELGGVGSSQWNVPAILSSELQDSLITNAYRPYGRAEADMYLADKPEGTFVLRPSSSGQHTLCVSYVDSQPPYENMCRHCLIKKTSRGFVFHRSKQSTEPAIYFDHLRPLLIDHQIIPDPGE